MRSLGCKVHTEHVPAMSIRGSVDVIQVRDVREVGVSHSGAQVSTSRAECGKGEKTRQPYTDSERGLDDLAECGKGNDSRQPGTDSETGFRLDGRNASRVEARGNRAQTRRNNRACSSRWPAAVEYWARWGRQLHQGESVPPDMMLSTSRRGNETDGCETPCEGM